MESPREKGRKVCPGENAEGLFNGHLPLARPASKNEKQSDSSNGQGGPWGRVGGVPRRTDAGDGRTGFKKSDTGLEKLNQPAGLCPCVDKGNVDGRAQRGFHANHPVGGQGA